MSFVSVDYDPVLGAIMPTAGAGNAVGIGHSELPDSRLSVPALPESCPRCGRSPGRQELAAFFAGKVRSPIRAHTTGQAQLTQMTVAQVFRTTGETAEESRTIVFTDSRDDAARTAAGIALNTYRDQVRQVVRKAAHTYEDPLALLQALAAGTSIPTGALLPNRHQRDTRTCGSLSERSSGASLTRTKSRWSRSSHALLSAPVARPGRQRTTRDGGARNQPGRRRGIRAGDRDRSTLVPAPPAAGARTLGAASSVRHQGRARGVSAEGRTEVAGAVFDRGGRDTESSGIGYVTTSAAGPETLGLPGAVAKDVVSAVIRILGRAKRYAGASEQLGGQCSSRRQVVSWQDRQAA